MSDFKDTVETARITRLSMGAAIPEWLLVCEPAEAGAPRGNFRFAVDVKVVELDEFFAVFPVVPQGTIHGAGVIDDSGTHGHRIYAPTKPVRVINIMTTIEPLEVNAWQIGGNDPRLDQMLAAQRAQGGGFVGSLQGRAPQGMREVQQPPSAQKVGRGGFWLDLLKAVGLLLMGGFVMFVVLGLMGVALAASHLFQ